MPKTPSPRSTEPQRFELSEGYDAANFRGRQNELADLRSFIEHAEGGTVLIGGLRGVGKTKFLFNLEQRLKLKSQKIFFLEIALHDEITAKELRYVLLRSICHALAKVERQIKPWRLNGIPLFETYLLTWLRYSFIKTNHLKIKRSKEFNRLMRFVSYTKATEKIGRELKSAFNKSGVGLDHKISSAIDGELDLSNSRLEQMLRDYLEALSRLGIKVVFVFDELDKFDEKLPAKKIASKFKNLLTRNGTFAIFITSERDVRAVRQAVLNNPYCVEHTLFSRTLLLNQLSLEDFRDVVQGYFAVSVRNNAVFNELQDYIIWQSSLHLFSLKQFIDKYKIISSRGRPCLQIDTSDIGPEASLQHLLGEVYWDNESTKDDYYNRLLYLSLRSILQYLNSGESIFFSGTSFMLALVKADDFTNKEERDVFLTQFATRPEEFAKHFSETDWRSELSLLTQSEINRINYSINLLIWTLDECGALNRIGTKRSPLHRLGIEEAGLNKDELNYKNVLAVDLSSEDALDGIFKKEYSRLINIAQKIGYSEGRFEHLVLKSGGTLAAIKVNTQSSYKIRALYHDIEVTLAALERVEQQLRKEILPKFITEVGKKIDLERVEARDRMSHFAHRQQKTFHVFRVKGTVNRIQLYFIDSVLEREYKDFAAKQDSNTIIINVIYDDWKLEDLRGWYNVRLDDASNYRRCITQVIRTMNTLTKQ